VFRRPRIHRSGQLEKSADPQGFRGKLRNVAFLFTGILLFFSVITPSWNQGDFLARCLECVQQQGSEDYEHLVFDNCSTDQTETVVAEFPQVRLVREADRGQSHAVNKGLAAARGEIVCWLNADDAYPPGLFARLRELFKDPACDVVFGDVEQVAYDGRPPQLAAAVFRDRLDLVRWWSSRARLHQPAVFFRRKVYEATGPLREDLHYCMDYEYWWRISEKFAFHHVAEVLAIQHRQPESKTVRSWHRVYEERGRIFAPFYSLIDAGDRAALLREKSRTMSDRYLMNASAAAPTDGGAALADVWRGLREDPSAVLRGDWLGVLRRCF
jgi:glycosyltransferase involved in cell wall biosynthesis